MKNILLNPFRAVSLFLVASALLFSASYEASAQAVGSGAFDPGGRYNPIYVQPVYTQQQTTQQKIFQLQSLYGAQSYNRCAQGIIFGDDQQTNAMMVSLIEACLQKGSYQAPTNSVTPPGSGIDPQVMDAALKLLHEPSCAQDYSLNSSTGKCEYTGSNGRIDGYGGCKIGLVWSDETKKSCITQQEADMPCQKMYGQFAARAWITTTRKYACGCSQGYQWDTDHTSCIQVRNVAPAPKKKVASDEAKDVSGMKSQPISADHVSSSPSTVPVSQPSLATTTEARIDIANNTKSTSSLTTAQPSDRVSSGIWNPIQGAIKGFLSLISRYIWGKR